MKSLRLSILFMLVAVLLVSGFAQAVDITILNSKGEIQSQLEDAAALFSSQTAGVKIEVIPAPAGTSPYEKVISMYASGNAPTLSMLDPGDVARFSEKAYDLSSERWVNDAIDRSLDMGTLDDGRIVGFPVTVEGYGFIYNKALVDKAVGGNFDPATINSRVALEDLFKKLEASGVGALVISSMDWSLAGHFLPLSYSAQSKDPSLVADYFTALREGNIDLSIDEEFNGLISTFDLMKEYNIDKNDPLSSDYDRGSRVLGEGEVGLWFMGNWAWPNISEFDADGQYGFLPVPVSSNTAEYGNVGIPVGVTKYFIMDGEQSSPEQIQAAKDFLNWFVYDAEGQDALVNKAKVIPAFSNIALEPNDPLAKSILSYAAEGNTMEFITTLPPDHWSELGASMQKYLVDVVDREGLIKEIETYWKELE